MMNKILGVSLIVAGALVSTGANAQQCNGVSIDSIRTGTDNGTFLTTSGPGANCGFNGLGAVCLTDDSTGNRQYAAALTAQATGSTVTIAFDPSSTGCDVDGASFPMVTELRLISQ